jgi:hypothetical protein
MWTSILLERLKSLKAKNQLYCIFARIVPAEVELVQNFTHRYEQAACHEGAWVK